MTFALKACLQEKRYAPAAKLALKVAGELAGVERQNDLIQGNTDIAAALLSPDRIDELVSRRTFGGNWTGAHHAYEAGLLAGRLEFIAEARSRLRMATDWLYSWAGMTHEEREEKESASKLAIWPNSQWPNCLRKDRSTQSDFSEGGRLGLSRWPPEASWRVGLWTLVDTTFLTNWLNTVREMSG